MGKYKDDTLQISNIFMIASSFNIRKSSIGRIQMYMTKKREDRRKDVYGKKNDQFSISLSAIRDVSPIFCI